MANSKLHALWNHPAGPKTIHFWAPTFKWGLSIANVADFSKPADKISYPQQLVVATSGIIWSRYGTVITPRNWNLIGVNLAMSATGVVSTLSKDPARLFPRDGSPTCPRITRKLTRSLTNETTSTITKIFDYK